MFADSSKNGASYPEGFFLGFVAYNLIWVLIVGVNLLLASMYSESFAWMIILPFVIETAVLCPEKKDGSRWLAFSKHFVLFPPMRKYLQLSIAPVPQEVVDLDESGKNYILAAFPHGTASDFRILLDGMWEQVFPKTFSKIRTLAASVLFHIPVVRHFALWTGCINAHKKVAHQALTKYQRSLVILPGGEAEQIRTQRGKERVYLQDRKGFVKLALQAGVPLIPVYVFGSSDLYRTYDGLFFEARVWLQKKFGICICLYSGLWGSLFCPYPIRNTVVLGKPLRFDLQTPGQPTAQEVEAAHAAFCQALTRLFDSHKTKLGYGDRQLEIM